MVVVGVTEQLGSLKRRNRTITKSFEKIRSKRSWLLHDPFWFCTSFRLFARCVFTCVCLMKVLVLRLYLVCLFKVHHNHGFSHRRIGLRGSNGRVYHFLVQYSISHITRSDERMMQVKLANARSMSGHLSLLCGGMFQCIEHAI